MYWKGTAGELSHACRADDLDTRLLRAMVIKGILEQITTARVNLVNADLLAKNRGLRIIEQTVPADGKARARKHACPLIEILSFRTCSHLILRAGLVKHPASTDGSFALAHELLGMLHMLAVCSFCNSNRHW